MLVNSGQESKQRMAPCVRCLCQLSSRELLNGFTTCKTAPKPPPLGQVLAYKLKNSPRAASDCSFDINSDLTPRRALRTVQIGVCRLHLARRAGWLLLQLALLPRSRDASSTSQILARTPRASGRKQVASVALQHRSMFTKRRERSVHCSFESLSGNTYRR